MKKVKNTIKLPEEIGKGINKDHLEKVLEARGNLDSIITFKINSVDKKLFEQQCKKLGFKPSFINRTMTKQFTKDN